MSQGETVSLAPAIAPGLPVKFSLTNGSTTYNFIPLPGTASNGWKPGMSVYLFRNATGFWATDSMASVKNNTGFFPGLWTVNIIDATSDVLIAQDNVYLTGSGVTPIIYPVYKGFTVEAWIKWNIPPNSGGNTSRSWATIVVDGDRDSNTRYHLQHNSDNTHFEFAAATNTSRQYGQSTTTPAVNTWYYVVGVYNQTDPGNRLKLYVNGVLEKSIAIDGGGLKASPNRYQVGGPAGIQWPGPTSMLRKFDGDIRGLKTYEKAIGSPEVASRYAAGLPAS